MDSTKEPLSELMPTLSATMETPHTPYRDDPSEKSPTLSPPLPPSSTQKLRLVVWRLLRVAVLALVLYTIWDIQIYPYRHTASEGFDSELVITESEAGSDGCENLPYFAGGKNLAERLGYKLVVDVPREKIPGGKGVKNGGESSGRVIILGDVHGMFHELVTLLKKVRYDQDNDYLVFSGDIISKGPDSLKVLDLARSYGAGCVRGNHEDRILLHYHQLQKKKKDKKGKGGEKEKYSKPQSSDAKDPIYSVDKLDDMEMDEPSFDWLSSVSFTPSETETETEIDSDPNNEDECNTLQIRTDKKLARKLSRKQAAWLDACPLVLRMKKVSNIGQVEVVHAGLVHGVRLEDQDPNAIMNMRSLDKRCHMPLPEGNKNGIHWADVWNREEKHEKGMHTTVVYGHYAAKGLDIRPYSKGLDSNCVRGGRLSAFVISSKKEEIVSVRCRNFLKD